MATKMDLVKELAKKRDASIADTTGVVQDFLEVFIEAIRQGEVRIQDVGTWKQTTRKARTGRNPRTGEQIQIPERIVVHFTPSKNLLPAKA